MSRFSNLEFESDAEGERRSTEANVTRDEAFHLREAQAAFEEGDFERALRSYSRVLEHNPQNAAAWTGQVRMLIELGEFREAKLWADKALEKFPHEAELLAAKAVALARTGDLRAALAFSDASFEERGDTPYLWIARGDVLLARKEDRADYCFEKAVTHAATNWFVRWLISRVRFHYAQFVLALKAAQEALAHDAAHAVPWLQLALCQRELGFVAAAAESLARAAELNPQNAAARAAAITVQEVDFIDHLRGWLRRRFSR